MKKNLKEQEVRTPNQDVNPKSDSFNRELFKFLESSNWSSQDNQKRIVALINSIILTGGQNVQSQSIILDYLERGLDVLNVEIQRLEVDPSQKKVVEVDPEEVDAPEQVQESIRRRKNILRIIHENLHRFKENESLLKETKLFVDVCKRINEQDTNQQKPEKENAEQADQSDIHLNNFRTFANNFFGNDLGWSDEYISSILPIIEKFVRDFGKESRLQASSNIEIRNLSQAFGKITGQSDKEHTSNSLTAQQELLKYGQTYKGWSSELLTNVITNLFNMVLNAKNKSHINILLKKLKDIQDQIK